MYAQEIREEAARQGRLGSDPRHIEAWMRLEHGCLDGLGKEQFRSEVKTALACMDAATVQESESLADSFSL